MAQAVIDFPMTSVGPTPCAECAECVRQQLGRRPGVRRIEIDRGTTETKIKLEYDPSQLTLAELERELHRSGGCFSPVWGHAVLPLEGMVSPQSEQLIEAALKKLPGVMSTASYASQLVRVEYDRRKCHVPDIIGALRRLGYAVRGDVPQAPARAAAVESPKKVSTHDTIFSRVFRRPIAHPELSLPLLGGLLLLGAVGAQRLEAPVWIRAILLIFSFALSSRYTGVETLHSLRYLRLDIDVLMFAAALGAVLLGRYEEGALLLTLFGIGTAGENLAMDRARNAVQALGKLVPETASVRNADGSEREVPTSQLVVGDQVIVRPFDRVPVDGDVISGASSVDQSAVTGESMPVEKGVGSSLFAGSMNGENTLLMAVTHPAGRSMLARIVQLVSEAQTTKSPTQLLTDRVERWYVPFVLLGTAACAMFPPLAVQADWSDWFYRAMAFLVAASPCALAIGTPAAVLSGIARAARGGVLIKGGAHLENLGRIRAVAFDKTGTLTRGRAVVTDVIPCGSMSESEILTFAAAVEHGNRHPLAAAIVVEGRLRGLMGTGAEDVRLLPGRGIRGMVEGRPVFVGRITAPGDGHPDPAVAETLAALETQGKTAVTVFVDEVPQGVIGLSDPPRNEATDVLRSLRDMGVRRTVMLTGDNERVAAATAGALGLDEYHAALLPEDKVARLREIQRVHGPVAMIGDGVNDAPALAAATVGVAMGVGGTDVALETADVALMSDELTKLPEVIGLSRFSRRIIAQNLLIALGVIAFMAPAAVLGWTTLGVAVVFHEGSTVLVVLNALRLLVYRRR